MRFLITALFLLLPAWSAASGFEPVERILEAAVRAVAPDAEGNPDVRAEAALDPGLRMPACPECLSAHVGNRGVAEVACNGSTGWRLFVPVRVTRLEPVLVLQRPIAAGQTLSADLLAVEKRNTSHLAGPALSSKEQAVGQLAARALMAGSVLSATDLQSPRLVKRGDRVTLVARSGGLEVRSQGRALGDAGLAEQVNVENLGTRRQVRGRVNARGEVEVLL